MRLEYLSGLSWPGDRSKPNDDAFCHCDGLAAVFDGATSLNDPLLPADSDAAWIARKGAEGLMLHQAHGAREALRLAAADAERDFIAQRHRAPVEQYETPLSSMMLVAPAAGGLEFFWFGDCAALIERPGEAVEVIGDAFARRASEAGRVAHLAQSNGLAPASGANRPEYLPALRAARNRMNRGEHWTFSPDARCAEHAASKIVATPLETRVLLCSDGFLALASDYNRYSPGALVGAARERGLRFLFEELRAVEDGDPEGRRFPRFKKSDDATALLVMATKA